MNAIDVDEDGLVTLYAKNGGTITMTRHKPDECTNVCTDCGLSLDQAPSSVVMLKSDEPICFRCSPTGVWKARGASR